MKVLFCGLGSIGTRHLKNLHAAAARSGVAVQAYALRSSARALAGEVKALLAGEFSALPQEAQFDAAFITNPTSLHYCAAKQGRCLLKSPFSMRRAKTSARALRRARRHMWRHPCAGAA